MLLLFLFQDYCPAFSVISKLKKKRWHTVSSSSVHVKIIGFWLVGQIQNRNQVHGKGIVLCLPYRTDIYAGLSFKGEFQNIEDKDYITEARVEIREAAGWLRKQSPPHSNYSNFSGLGLWQLQGNSRENSRLAKSGNLSVPFIIYQS